MPDHLETTPEFVGARAPAPRGAAPFRWERKLMGFHSSLVYVFLYAPIIILIIFSFNEARQTARWEGFTLDWYGKLMSNKQLLNSVKNSLLVAGVTTVFSTVIGTMAALALGRYTFQGKGATQATLFLPIIIPEIVFGAALVTFFGAVEWRLSIWTVIISHIAFSISYVAIVVRARLAGFDRSLEEAAMDLGAGPIQTFFRVTLPLILPGVVAGALLVFTISIDDYVISSFVAGVGATTLPLQIYSMIKRGVTPEVNAVSTLLLLVTVVMIILAQRLQQEPGKGETKR
ncbi:MAG TPA: ABC transporter permease [Kiritimatiellia bacterium]|nr:ABC transporter permease [Kiritimatiellia bacterium]